MIVVTQANVYSYIGTTRYHSVPTHLHLKYCSGQSDLIGHGQRKCRRAQYRHLGDNDIACQMTFRLHSEEYTAYLKNKQTEPGASVVWQGFVKNQAQCIFHCKHLSSVEKHSNSYQHISDSFCISCSHP